MGCKPAIALRSVVLPHPLGPKITRQDPFGAETLTSSRMRAFPMSTTAFMTPTPSDSTSKTPAVDKTPSCLASSMLYILAPLE